MKLFRNITSALRNSFSPYKASPWRTCDTPKSTKTLKQQLGSCRQQNWHCKMLNMQDNPCISLHTNCPRTNWCTLFLRCGLRTQKSEHAKWTWQQHTIVAFAELLLKEAYQAFHLHGHASIVARTRRWHKETPLQAKETSNQLQLQNLAPLPDAATQPRS